MGTLGEELARLELYARIERSRFEDDLQVTLDVAPELRRLPCLPMLLQPLVENAIKHGFARSEPPLHVDLRAEQRDGLVTVRVTNDGELEHRSARSPPQAKPDASRAGLGLGLPATRRRLEQEYGSAALLELAQSTEGGGQRVTATATWPVQAPGLDPVSRQP
jgi:LytS/YehU family sensor histidine kinase